MASSAWTEADTNRVLHFWSEYQKQHGLSGLKGQTAGIDPAGGRIWFGESATDIWQAMEGEGIDIPLYYMRVGFDNYVRKGGHGVSSLFRFFPLR